MSSKLQKIGYDLKDVAVVQSIYSYYNHRSEVNPFIEICGRSKQYPVIVSPMASVTDQNNYKVWIDAGFTPVVPRSVQKSDDNPTGITWEERLEISKETFVSISLSEAEILEKQFVSFDKFYICIDIANGTLKSLYDVCTNLKKRYGKSIVIMTGNVANPEAYRNYVASGIDYMRVSVGTGSRCTTACNTGIYYPSATLLDELYQEKCEWEKSHLGQVGTKLIMDGGISNFDDIQKAIALGADAVMSGSIFVRAEEACGDVIYAEDIESLGKSHRNYTKAELDKWFGDFYKKYNISENSTSGFGLSADGNIEYRGGEVDNLEFKSSYRDFEEYSYMKSLKPFREYYGMSTKRAQKETGGVGNKTAEGISRPVLVEYPIKKWADNMESFLRSNMTYTNSKNLEELREKSKVIILGGSDRNYRK